MKPNLLTLLAGLALAGPALAQDPAPADPANKAQDAEAEKPKVYEVGTQVPEELTLVDMDGKKLSMKEARGKVVVMVWYAYKCPAIKQANPLLKKMAAAYAKTDGEVLMIGINSDRGELLDAKPEGVDEDGNPKKPFHALRTALQKNKMNFPVFIDKGNVVADLFQAKTTPHVFVLDAKGVVRYSGALDNDPRGSKKADEKVNYVNEAVKAIRAGEEVQTATTRPYG